MNTRTYVRVVFAVLGLAACSSASTTEPTTTTTLSLDSGANADPRELLRAQYASSFTDSLRAGGLTVTSDQAKCIADAFVDKFSLDEIAQVERDKVAGRSSDPDVMDRGMQVVIECLSAE
jgi:hypothetical protein